MAEFPGKGKVAVLKTSPETVSDDIHHLMKKQRSIRHCQK